MSNPASASASVALFNRTSRPLKRSASTASIGSMPPTPPRTHRKHTRGRSRGSCDSDSEDDALLSGADEDEDTNTLKSALTSSDAHKSKKRRTSEAVAAKDEEAFWIGGAESSAAAVEAGSSRNVKTQKAPLLYRRMLQQQQQQQQQQQEQQQQTEVAPVSPPPSHRRPTAKPTSSDSFSALPLPPLPTTPRTRSAVKRGLTESPENPLSDSPENPFLATPQKVVEDSATPSPSGIDSGSGSSANPSPHTPGSHIEKPTVTYVFRGVRRIYQNPMYNHADNRPYSPPPASKLPIDHPDYSPDMNCAPRLLFPAARKNTRSQSNAKAMKAAARATTLGKSNPKQTTGKRGRSPTHSDDEELDVDDFRPQKLDFGVLENKQANNKKTKKNVTTLDEEFKIAGESLSL